MLCGGFRLVRGGIHRLGGGGHMLRCGVGLMGGVIGGGGGLVRMSCVLGRLIRRVLRGLGGSRGVVGSLLAVGRNIRCLGSHGMGWLMDD